MSYAQCLKGTIHCRRNVTRLLQKKCIKGKYYYYLQYRDGDKVKSDYVNQNNITILYSKNNDLTTITIKKNIKTNMPLINKILGNNIETKRTVYEQ